MDMGVALVQAYLRVHGYLTVSEYPILETMRHGEHRIATDIDILAVRFPHACQLVPQQGRNDEGDVDLETPDEALVRDGHTFNPAGHRVRLVAFGSVPPERNHPRYRVVLLRDVLGFLRRFLRTHWDVLHHADFKDPAFSFLMMLEKAGAHAEV